MLGKNLFLVYDITPSDTLELIEIIRTNVISSLTNKINFFQFNAAFKKKMSVFRTKEKVPVKQRSARARSRKRGEAGVTTKATGTEFGRGDFLLVPVRQQVDMTGSEESRDISCSYNSEDM